MYGPLVRNVAMAHPMAMMRRGWSASVFNASQ
jgi:hypothetical protein